MGSERRSRLRARLTGVPAELETTRLCEVGAEVTGTSGAGIMVMTGDVSQGAVWTTNEVSALIEELQFTLGEGPCVDAYHQRRPVLEPDLAEPARPRWVAFSGPAVDAGVRAVFGFPLRIGDVRLGALDLYRDHPGPMSDDQHADAMAMADITTRALLAMQAGALPGRLTAALDEGADLHYVVHQATGMIAAQLGVEVGQALVRLRAYAFGNERPLRQVAEEVVDRRLRFDGRDGQDDPPPRGGRS